MSHPIEEGFEVGLADELDEFIKSGEWGKRTAETSQAVTPEPSSREKDEIQKQRKNFLLKAVFAPFFLQYRFIGIIQT